MHFSNRALGLMHVTGRTGSDELAVKVVLPAGCDASPDAAMAASGEMLLG